MTVRILSGLLLIATLCVSTPVSAHEEPLVEVNLEHEGGINQQLEQVGVVIRMDRPEGAILAVALPDAYILPGSPLYWLVRFWESLTLFIADSPEEKSELLFSFAEKRLAETMKLLEKEHVFQAAANLERYKGQLNEATTAIQDVSDQQVREQQYSRLEEQVWYQKALLRIIDTESVANILSDVSSAFAPQFGGQAGIELEPIL